MRDLLLIALAFVFLGVACRSTQEVTTVSLATGHDIVFLDSVQAASVITIDNAEGFFGQIGKLDMAIQLRKNFPEDTPRQEVLREYQEFLRQDVTSFTPKEVQILTETWQEAYRRCEDLASDFFPPKIELIKTIGRHYGPGVYYTRENSIVIPASDLLDPTVDNLLPVMLHELFHIYSRNHPEKRAALYRLIGFEILDIFPSELLMEPTLRERILLNPDGIHYGVTIQLQTENGMQQAIPILRATESKYDPSKPSFFSHLDFNLYPLEEVAKGKYRVISDADGNSPLQVEEEQDFFRQIRDNTEYIIHPEEIMADNFVWLILSGAGKLAYRTERLSAEGKALLEEVEEVLER